jgi:FimV-like protein
MAEKNPDDSRILFYTALALEQNGQIDEAISTLKLISISDMLAPEATVRIAYLLNREGRNWEAVTFLQKRLEEIPGNPQIMLALARIYQDTGDARQAISLLEEAVEKGHGSKDILMQLAMLCEKLGKRKQGLEWAQRALDLDGSYVPALNFIGYTWAEQGINLDQAEEMVKKAVSLQPDDGYIIDSLGWVYYAQGRYKDAVRELKRAHELVPDDPTIAEHLADALTKRQKYFQALKIYKKAFELEKDKKNRRRLKKKIRRASDLTLDMIDQ